jgi:hypothetical protein
MNMDWHAAALVAAGIIGIGVAIIHGILVQRLMIKSLQTLPPAQFPTSVRKVMAMLLHFSTFNWLVGGLALIISAYAFGQEARLVTGILTGSSYLFGALGNFWGTRGRHPGWVLYGLATLLIVYGLCGIHG